MRKIIFLVIVTIWILLIFACNPAKRATDYMKAHPEVNAPVCAEQFPVKDSLILGDTIIIGEMDTNYVIYLPNYYDSANTTPKTGGIPLCTSRVIYTTKLVTNTLLREDSAKIKVYEIRVNGYKDSLWQERIKHGDSVKKLGEMTEARNKNRARFWWAIAAYAATIALLVFIAVKRRRST